MSRFADSEASLVDAFLAASGADLPSGARLREFETLAGIPDVVIVEPLGRANELEIELRACRALTNGHANVLTSLSQRVPHTLDYLVDRTGLGRRYVQRILSDLARMGLTEVTATGSVLLSRAYAAPQVRFTAIEFKLSDWRRALSQAVRHQAFADRSLVIMPANRKGGLRDSAPAFRAYGVGSAVFDAASGQLTYVVRPRARRRKSDRIFLDAVGRASAALTH